MRPVTFDPTLIMAKSRACVQFASCHASCREIGTSTSINHGRLGDVVEKPSERLNSGGNFKSIHRKSYSNKPFSMSSGCPTPLLQCDWANGRNIARSCHVHRTASHPSPTRAPRVRMLVTKLFLNAYLLGWKFPPKSSNQSVSLHWMKLQLRRFINQRQAIVMLQVEKKQNKCLKYLKNASV